MMKLLPKKLPRIERGLYRPPKIPKIIGPPQLKKLGTPLFSTRTYSAYKPYIHIYSVRKVMCVKTYTVDLALCVNHYCTSDSFGTRIMHIKGQKILTYKGLPPDKIKAPKMLSFSTGHPHRC